MLGAEPPWHVRERRNPGGEGGGAGHCHPGGSETRRTRIAAAGKGEDEAIAATTVTAGMKQLRKRQTKMSRRGKGPCGCLDFAGMWSFDFAG